MSDRNTILKQLKTDLRDYIKSTRTSTGGRRFKSDLAEVRRGIHSSKDFEYFPVVCFTCFSDEVENEFGGDGTRWLSIYLYGYDSVSGYANDDDAYDAIHDLALDIEEFLYNDFTYTSNVLIGDIIIYEAGVEPDTTWFEASLRIKYDYNI